MAGATRQMRLDEFGRRLRDHLSEPDCRIVWFLGAGCSISSGIPGAAALVDEWLPRLKRYVEGDDDAWQEWARKEYEGYDASPALIYGDVMERLFPTARDRQQEVERLTAGREPGIGYALLALLMAHVDHGARTNVVLTTNFDDLVADALYLLTQRKPLVVAHENLARFVWQSHSRPLVVKLHGDAMLAPKNTTDETAEVDHALRQRVLPLLQRCMLIFCGYGGNDESIAAMIDEADEDAFPLGIYWIGGSLPSGPMGAALARRPFVVHVEHRDFDAFLIALAEVVGVDWPGMDRWQALFRRYEEALGRKVADAEPGPQRASASRMQSQLQARRLAWDAYTIGRTDPDRAEQMFEQAVETAPDDPDALGNYALFLKNVREDAERADEFFRRAVDADPSHANNLGNYANFLADVREDAARAEEFYRRAVDADPSHANNLGNYAVFLADVREDAERAEEFFRWAVDADPSHANALGSYAVFLKKVRTDAERAEEFYRRAIDADPSNPTNLGNYAVFLANVRKDAERAEEFFRRAIDADPNHANNLGNYAQTLFGRDEDAEATRLCDTARAQTGPESLLAEIAFYLYAHRPDRAAVALDDLRGLLAEGVRSGGWDFSSNLDRARRDADPRLPFLIALADVIAERADLTTLDAFPEWTDAKDARSGE